MKNPIRMILIISLILGFSYLVLFRIRIKESYQKKHIFFAMDTFLEISIEDKSFDKKIFKAIEDKVSQIDFKLNAYNKNSELSKINISAGLFPVKVSSDVFNILTTVLSYAKKSNGLFDITFQPIQDLYGFSSGNYNVPNQIEIKKTKELVDFKYIVMNPSDGSVFLKKKNMVINLSGIIKGYVLDEIKKLIESNKIERYHLNFGGNLYIHSNKKEKIGIKHPRMDSIIKIFWIQDGFISTSADYQQYFEKNGSRYSHIVNPLTGSAQSKMQSVTVVGDSGIESDFLSTFLYLKDPAILNQYIIESFPGILFFAYDGEKEYINNLEVQP